MNNSEKSLPDKTLERFLKIVLETKTTELIVNNINIEQLQRVFEKENSSSKDLKFLRIEGAKDLEDNLLIELNLPKIVSDKLFFMN